MSTRPPTNDLLDETLEFFWLQGFKGSNITELVACTQLNRHILYEHFGSKHALAQLTLKHYRLRLQEELALLPLAWPLEARRLAAAWQHPPRGSLLARMRARGCFGRQLSTEDRELEVSDRRDPGALATGLRQRIAKAAPRLPEPLADALCAVLLGELERGLVKDLAASLEALLPASREELLSNS